MFSSSSTNRNPPFPPHLFLGHDGGQDTTFSFSQYYFNNTDLLMNDFLLANFPAMDSISSSPPPPLPPLSPLVPNKTPTVSTTTTTNQDYGQELGFPRKKKHGKTDRHSKICTAQGPRDRRVRLSIGIARRFFDLQDMLGFDKASKTIDWLLNKSKAAIKEVSDECNFEEEEKVKKAASSCPARESRAKARARARERTIEKLSSKHSDLMIKKKKSSPDCDQNWEISGSSSHSSYQTMSGMNISPEFEVSGSGRSWEVYNYKNNQNQS